MARSNLYYTLFGSLPALPAHFADAERVPISQLRLDERLRMLKPEDARVIEQLTDFLAWDRQPLDRTDEAMVRHYDEFRSEVANDLACQVIENAMTLRVVVAALRRRKRALGPPTANGPWMDHIRRNWKHADFRLAQRFGWIRELDARLNEDPPQHMDRALQEVGWRIVRRLSERYQFSFEAVVLYLVRWEFVYRWTSHDAVKGREQYESLVREAMDQYADMFGAAAETAGREASK